MDDLQVPAVRQAFDSSFPIIMAKGDTVFVAVPGSDTILALSRLQFDVLVRHGLRALQRSEIYGGWASTEPGRLEAGTPIDQSQLGGIDPEYLGGVPPTDIHELRRRNGMDGPVV